MNNYQIAIDQGYYDCEEPNKKLYEKVSQIPVNHNGECVMPLPLNEKVYGDLRKAIDNNMKEPEIKIEDLERVINARYKEINGKI